MLHNQRLSIRVLPMECTPTAYKMRELSSPSRGKQKQQHKTQRACGAFMAKSR